MKSPQPSDSTSHYSIVELLKQEKLRDQGLPLESHNQWPADRTGERYCQLVRPKLPDAVAEAAMVDLNELIEEECIIVDTSTGDGNAVKYFKRETNTFIGISMHEVRPENAECMDLVAYTSIPYGPVARRIFSVLRRKVDLLFDIYGSTSYGENPIHVIIDFALLLKPKKGVAYIVISSIKGESADQSPIGYSSTRAKLALFFKQQLGVELKITRTFLQSAINPDDICIDYVVKLSAGDVVAENRDIQELYHAADRIFGRPRPIDRKSSWGKFADGFALRANHFQHNRITTQLQPSAFEIKRVQSGEDNGVHPICLMLAFSDPDVCSSFLKYFDEFYQGPEKTPWTLERLQHETIPQLFFRPIAKQKERQALLQFDAVVNGLKTRSIVN